MRSKGTAAELEARRLRAADLLAAAKTPAQVAALIGAGHSSAKKWKAALANGSKETLTAKTPPESNSKLSDSQKSELVEILMRGPLASGFRTDLWTCRRVAEVVQKRFGVSYHPGRILHNLSFTPQKPEQLARERDEEAIQRCPQQDWPHIKRARRRRAPVIFLDETAFRLQVSKTPHLGAAGPNSCTALLGSRRPSLGLGAIRLSPQRKRLDLRFNVWHENICTRHVLRFLKQLRHELRRPLVMVRDRLPAHRSAARQLREAGYKDIHFEWLPAYASDLNPVEALWSHTKYSDLANFLPEDQHELRRSACHSIQAQSRQKHLLRSFFHAAKLKL